MSKLFIALFLMFLMQESAWSATRYADNGSSGCSSPSDTDYNPVTRACGAGASTVYNTINGAITASSSGDTVLVQAGTYAERKSDLASNITIQGYDSTPANWPVLRPTSGSNVFTWNVTPRSGIVLKYLKLDVSAITSPDSCLRVNDGYAITFTLEDFTCTGNSNMTETASGIALGNLAVATIKRGTISTIISADPTKDGPGAHGIYWRASNSLVEHVVLTNYNGYCMQIWATGYVVQGNTVRNNVCAGRSAGSTEYGALFVATNAASGTPNLVHNNIVKDSLRGIETQGTNHKFYNNTILPELTVPVGGSSGIYAANCTSGCVLANNIVLTADTAITAHASVTQTTNRTTGAVADIFIDATNNNFSLKESSLAIDAGTVISDFSTGRYVGVGVDQGALESPIRVSGITGAVVEDATPTIYRVSFDMPIQSTRNNVGLQTCTVTNTAIVVGGGAAQENSCSTSASASRLDITLNAAVTNGQSLTDAYNRSTEPTLMDNACIGDPNTTCYNAHVRTYSATAGTNNVGGGAGVTFTQTRYRFHQLRGTETSPVIICVICTENVDISTPPGAAFRLRIKFKTDNDPAGINFKLRYSKDAGAYTDIPDIMGADFIAWYGTTGSSDIPAAGTATTELLTSDEATNVACSVVRSSSDYPNLDFNNGETECEYVLQLSNSVSPLTTYDFRVYKGDNTALDTYSVSPRLTVGNYAIMY